MARFRLARPAEHDLAKVLATSAERWGTDGRRNCAAVLAAAMRQVADEPRGPLTRNRTGSADAAKVRKPVHVLYYRVAPGGVIEIVRVLHERMDPRRHLDDRVGDGDV
jgi:toxin ParE1/3/4